MCIEKIIDNNSFFKFKDVISHNLLMIKIFNSKKVIF